MSLFCQHYMLSLLIAPKLWRADFWVAQKKKDCLIQGATLPFFNLKTNKYLGYRKTDGSKKVFPTP